MNKNFIYAMLSAIALTGAVGFSSCTSSDDVAAELNPNYDPESNSVLTKFVFNVSTNNQANTRQSVAATQATNGSTFRGIQDAYLLPYTISPAHASNNHLYDISTDAKATATRSFDFSTLLTSGEITDENSRRVLELSLPVGTNALMFYGRATHNPTTYNADEFGSVDFTVSKNANNTQFSLKSRLENTDECNETFDLYECILNHITRAGLQQETEGENGAKTTRDLRYAFWWPIDNTSKNYRTRVANAPYGAPLYANGKVGSADDVDNMGTPDDTSDDVPQPHSPSYTFYTGTISWKDYGDYYVLNHDENEENDYEWKALEEIVASSYHSFTTINPQELRAGGSEALRYTMQDLYSVIRKVSEATAGNIPEHIAKLLATEVVSRILLFFNNSDGFAWKALADLKTAVENNVYGKSSADFSHINGDISNFPVNLNMPIGSALLDCNNSTHEWKYLINIPNYDMGGTISSSTTLDKYNYPAEIFYYGNSPLRVSDVAHATDDYPKTVSAWDDDTSANKKWTNDWTANGTVASTTRSVAMQKNINYGSALLKTSVSYSSATIYDNNNHFNPTEEDTPITTGTGVFKLTGILIAGLPKTVGWNFIPKKGVDNKYHFDDMVFDKEIVDQTIPTPANKQTYTLVWDTFNPDASAYNPETEGSGQNQVFVALEFQNLSGKNLWGQANLIRNQGFFYIIGTLNPNGKTIPAKTAGTYIYNLPPYDASGDTQDIARVFIQDHVTTANFVLNENSLKHAYVTIPDLRASQISLGLSVDINWETGITFDNVILGGEAYNP